MNPSKLLTVLLSLGLTFAFCVGINVTGWEGWLAMFVLFNFLLWKLQKWLFVRT